MDDAKSDCLSRAVKNAKFKASRMALAAGSTVGRLLTASDQVVNAPTPYRMGNKAVMSMASDGAEASSISINSKDEEVKVSVSTVWEIK